MSDERVLELRVHGIANAPPADMLGTTPDNVAKASGDEFGSFWQRRIPEPDADPNLLVEAYSWGNQTRSGGNALAVIGRVFVHLSWLFVLPFGLCNLAYWARQDIPGDKAPGSAASGPQALDGAAPAVGEAPTGARRGTIDEAVDRPRWHSGTGALAIRWFALLQTLFYTAGFMSVMVDLIAVQCYRLVEEPDGKVVRLVCAALPQWFDIFEDWNRVSRSALFAVVPVLAMLVIYLVGLRVRGAFEPNRDFEGESLEVDEVAARQRSAEKRAAKSAAKGAPAGDSASSSGSDGTGSTAPDGATEAGTNTDANSAVGDGTSPAEPAEPENPAAAPGAPAVWPLLGSRGFWRRARVAQTSERAHFAGVLSFVLLLLTIDALFELPDLAGTDPNTWASVAADKAPVALMGFIVSLGLMVLTIIVVSLSVNDTGGLSVRATRRLATTVLVSSAICYVAWTLWSIFGIARGSDGSGDERFEGLSVAPVAISTICALIALSSLTWPYRVRRVLSAGALVAAFVCVLLTYPEIPDATRWALSLVALVLALFALALGYLSHSPDELARRKMLGWHGSGPAVIMLLALFSSMVITSLLVIGAHAWLSTSTESPTTADRIWRVLPENPAFALIPPTFYEQFAVSLLAILALFVLLAAAVGVTAFARMPQLTVPELLYPQATDPRRKAADRNRGGIARPDGPGYPVSEANLHDKERVVAKARRLAAVAHRGEQMLASLAILTAVTLLLLAMPIVTLTLAEWQYWALFRSIAGWALGLFALAIMTAVVANAVTSVERPLGLVWDIICFFPRAAHPFTPPCYAERTVPEIEERLEDWFRGDAADDRSVILSAHSMGAPIVVAVVFSVAADGAPRELVDGEPLDSDDRESLADTEPLDDSSTVPLERVALLTYGVQLRAYFGRFFPAVFGPQVLGTQGTYAPSLFRRDPWGAEVKREWQIPPKRAMAAKNSGTAASKSTAAAVDSRPAAPRTTLVEILGGDPAEGTPPRWRSLWRRTDYLGFPVESYRSDGNPVDRGASERAPRPYLWTVARHNDYMPTLQYIEARNELLSELRSSRGGAPGNTTDEPLRARHAQPPDGTGGSHNR